MTEQSQFFDAWAAAEEGMGRAVDHADRVDPGWSDEAAVVLRDYATAWARAWGDTPFMAEDVRAYAEEQGFTKPPDDRAWGAVFVRARKQGVIARVGLALTQRRCSHKRPQTAWRLA
jgi:hypothetical protein